MAMIGLPVLIICAGAAQLATVDVSARESLPASVGQAQALISTRFGTVEQAVDGTVINESGESVVPTAGHRSGEPWTAAQLVRLTGGQVGVSGLTEALVHWSAGSQRATARVIGREVLAGSGLVGLVEGRLPDRPGQVLVTEEGVAAGIPRSGRITVSTRHRDEAAEIVGVVHATGPAFESVALVVGEEWQGPALADSYLLLRDRPVTWADVLTWNAHGLSVISPTVMDDPPAGVPATAVARSSSTTALVVVVSLGLVLETALLAGPAFAVSAARRRRTLALVASNGADRGQIARYVMAQGVVLGAVATVVGAGLGTVAGWASVRGIAAIFDPSLTSSIGAPPLDTYGWAVAMIMVVAFAAAAVSALVPGLKVAGLDVAGALAGRAEQRRSNRGYPVVGAVALGAGVLSMELALRSGDSVTSLVGIGSGGGLMIIGALFLIPLIVERAGSGFAAAPVGIRMGVRDACRSRSRTVPAVAAITVVVAVLVMITTSWLSNDELSRRDYLPSTLPGAAQVESDGPVQATLDEIRTQHPTWTIEPAGRSWVGATDGSGRTWQVTVVAANTVNPAALSLVQRTALDQGSLLVSDPDLIEDGKVQLAYGAHGADPAVPSTVLRTVRVPAVSITADQYRALTFYRDNSSDVSGAVITPAGADTIALPWTRVQYEVTDPAGPISRADERAVNDRVLVPMSVERGYQSGASWIVVALVGIAVALVLVGTLISTALTQVEARPVSTTLAAMGASRGLRRRAAAAQAVLIASLGVVLGVGLGLAPGLGLAASLTTDGDLVSLTPVLVVPYAVLASVVLGVPLLAAGLAAIMVRRDPVLTRRPT